MTKQQVTNLLTRYGIDNLYLILVNDGFLYSQRQMFIFDHDNECVEIYEKFQTGGGIAYWATKQINSVDDDGSKFEHCDSAFIVDYANLKAIKFKITKDQQNNMIEFWNESRATGGNYAVDSGVARVHPLD